MQKSTCLQSQCCLEVLAPSTEQCSDASAGPLSDAKGSLLSQRTWCQCRRPAGLCRAQLQKLGHWMSSWRVAFWKVTLALYIGDVLKEPEGIFLFAIFPPAAVPQLIKL